MRNTLSMTTWLVVTLSAAGAFGQGMPRGQGGHGSGDNRSPSMSPVQPPARSGRDRTREEGNRRQDTTPGKPAATAPATRQAPPPNHRPGVGSVPSGEKRLNRFDPRGFVQLPDSKPGGIARPASPPARQPARPAAVQQQQPPAHRPPIHQAPPPRLQHPRVYRPDWSRRTPFTPSWYKTRAPSAPPHRSARFHPWLFDRPGWGWNHWWARATLAALNSWLRFGWARPVYYVYGTGGNVFYQGNVVYVDGASCGTPDTYYEQARAIALSVPDLDEAAAARLEWLPLGVFAITRQGVTQTNTYVQLSVTREGIIGGTYYNEATGVSRPVEGMVDRSTQRAAWMFADGMNTEFVVETSFYNLTRDEVPVLVHFGPDRTQVGLLLRMEAPAEE